MTNDIPHPTEWPDIEKQERLIDALLAILERDGDREQVRSVIEILAEGLGLSISIHEKDPMKGSEWAFISRRNENWANILVSNYTPPEISGVTKNEDMTLKRGLSSSGCGPISIDKQE